MKNFLAAGVLALCLFAAQSAHAIEHQDPNSPAVIKAKMIENYLAIREAFKNADPDFLISFEAPEYTNVLQSGEVRSKTKTDEVTRFMMSRIQKVYDARVSIKAIGVGTQSTVVVNEQHLDADFLGPDNQIHRMNATLLSRDTWVRYGSEWRLKRAEDLNMKFEERG